jgi:ketosteroid isomerase-like protein
MHPHAQLLTRLFQCLNAHDYKGMSDCYHQDAVFHDIAFSLTGKEQIRAMWEMICSDNDQGRSDIVATVQELSADDSTGRVVVIDDYTFRETKRKVHNPIVSTFEFRNGVIFKQTDACDSVDWAKQAFGGLKGFVTGRIGFLRRHGAMNTLNKFDSQRNR